MDGILVAVLLLLAFGSGVAARHWLLLKASSARVRKAEREAQHHLADAKEEAYRYREAYVNEVKTALDEERQAFEAERESARRDLRRSKQKAERRERSINSRTRRLNGRETTLQKGFAALRLLQRETSKTSKEAEQLRASVDTLLADVTARRSVIADQEAGLASREESVEARSAHLDEVIAQQTRRLEQISQLTTEDARKELQEQLIDSARGEASEHIRQIQEEAKRTARSLAQKIVLTVIQRTASSQSVENTVSVVHLDSDDHKGRIIGREGRNIRAFEAASGTEVIVDDTPSAVVLSCFDPIRREVARRAMRDLLHDGRIHPVRIEKKIRSVRKALDNELVEIGQRSLIDLNIHRLHPKLVRLVGRMRFRSSYGQNLLAHSIETARIASMIAAEIGLEPALARRAGLLHDIGKVVPEPSDLSHALVGMELCKRYREKAAVCNAVGAHHDEIEMTALISPIVQAADAISGARPGARRSTVEEYIRRLEHLEALAQSFEGVERVFVFQAGREVRVIVNQSQISDKEAEAISAGITKRIEDELRYPGQIKVTVIREVRVTAYAR